MGRHRSDQPTQGFGTPSGPAASASPRGAPRCGSASRCSWSSRPRPPPSPCSPAARPGQPAGAGGPSCDRSLRVVTSSSFAPVLDRLEPTLGRGRGLRRRSTPSSSTGARRPHRVAEREADVWIPDDVSWAAIAGSRPARRGGRGRRRHGARHQPDLPGRRRRDRGEGRPRRAAPGSGWPACSTGPLRGPAGRAATRTRPATAWSPPAAWARRCGWTRGMDASSAALSAALPGDPDRPRQASALPDRPGEVGLVPEYALLAAPDRVGDATRAARHRPHRAAALQLAAHRRRRRHARAGRRAAAAARRAEGPAPPPTRLGAAGLRRPGGAAPPGAPAGLLPALTAKPLEMLKPHHVDHVFAAWYVQDRRSSILLAVDVSGSMAEPAPGTHDAADRPRPAGLPRRRPAAAGPVLARAVGLRLAARPAAGLPVLLPHRAAGRGPARRAGRRGRQAGRPDAPAPGSTTPSSPRTPRRPRPTGRTSATRWSSSPTGATRTTPARSPPRPARRRAEGGRGRGAAGRAHRRRVRGPARGRRAGEGVLEPVDGYLSKVQTPEQVAGRLPARRRQRRAGLTPARAPPAVGWPGVRWRLRRVAGMGSGPRPVTGPAPAGLPGGAAADLVEEIFALGGREVRLLRPRRRRRAAGRGARRGRPGRRPAAVLGRAVAQRRRAGRRGRRCGRWPASGCSSSAAGSAWSAWSRPAPARTCWPPTSPAEAVAFTAANAARNGVAVRTVVCAFERPAPLLAGAPWDLVLAADVLYESRNVPVLLDLLPRLVGPRRRGLARRPGPPARARLPGRRRRGRLASREHPGHAARHRPPAPPAAGLTRPARTGRALTPAPGPGSSSWERAESGWAVDPDPGRPDRPAARRGWAWAALSMLALLVLGCLVALVGRAAGRWPSSV